jgi:calcineurin-like phosphoesterase
MTGPHDSVIGMRKELVLARFSTGLPQSFKPSNKGARLQAVLIEAAAATGKADLIERIDIPLDE